MKPRIYRNRWQRWSLGWQDAGGNVLTVSFLSEWQSALQTLAFAYRIGAVHVADQPIGGRDE